MSRYVAITESEMSDFMSALGFTELSVDQRGSFGRRPVKERVYETPVGDGKIRVYSSVTGAVSRDRGKDAIRVQYWLGDQKVYGAKRVHRTQNWRKNLLQRTEEIRESADSGPLSRIPKDSRGDLMTARRGRLAHERFWGSVNYPELRESRRFEAVSVLPRGLKTDKITDRVMAIQYMMDDSEKQQKLLKLQTALKMGLITEDEILEKLDRAMSKNAESNVARKTEKEELILEQLNNNRQNSKYDGKFENTEGGICELLGITRSGVSKTLRDMESKGLIYSRNLHVPGGRRKVQCWFVVGSGTDRGFGAESYKPPASAISAAKRGLEQRKKYGRGGLSPAEAKSQGIDSGVTRARKIASGKVSKHDVRRMSAFNRHRKNNNPGKKMPDGGPTAGTIAWNLWGGTSGVNWAKKKSAAMNAEDMNAETLDYNSFTNDMEALLAKYSQLLLTYETEYQDGIMEVFTRFKPYDAYFDDVDFNAETFEAETQEFADRFEIQIRTSRGNTTERIPVGGSMLVRRLREILGRNRQPYAIDVFGTEAAFNVQGPYGMQVYRPTPKLLAVYKYGRFESGEMANHLNEKLGLL